MEHNKLRIIIICSTESLHTRFSLVHSVVTDNNPAIRWQEFVPAWSSSPHQSHCIPSQEQRGKHIADSYVA